MLHLKPGGLRVQDHSKLLCLVAHAFNLSAQEAEVGGSPTLKPVWTTQDTVSKQRKMTKRSIILQILLLKQGGAWPLSQKAMKYLL